MSARTKRQQRFFGAELARARAGKKTKTGLGKRTLKEMARKPKGGYRRKKKKKRRRPRRSGG